MLMLEVSPQVLDTVVTIVVAILSSTGVWSYLETKRKKIIEMNEKECKDLENMEKLLVALAKCQICAMCAQFVERGYIYNSEAEMLEHLYEPYKELGGNGAGEYMYDQAMKLPRKFRKDE